MERGKARVAEAAALAQVFRVKLHAMHVPAGSALGVDGSLPQHRHDFREFGLETRNLGGAELVSIKKNNAGTDRERENVVTGLIGLKSECHVDVSGRRLRRRRSTESGQEQRT